MILFGSIFSGAVIGAVGGAEGTIGLGGVAGGFGVTGGLTGLGAVTGGLITTFAASSDKQSNYYEEIFIDV